MKVFADQFSVCFFVSCVFLAMSRCPQDEACKCIQRPYMYTKAIHVYKGHTCIQSPYMYTKAIHVYKGHTCIQRPYMYTKPVNVYKGRTCIQRLYMYTKAVHVYKGRTCIQKPYMYTKAIHIYKGTIAYRLECRIQLREPGFKYHCGRFEPFLTRLNKIAIPNNKFQMASGQGSHWLIESPIIFSSMCSPPLSNICQFYF